MRITFITALGICSLTLFSCNKEDNVSPEKLSPNYISPSDSYLPMEIGNYWKLDNGNYTEIIDTLRIEGELFYKFFSIIGYDAAATEYMRLTKEKVLISKNPKLPGFTYNYAKFNANVGDTFFTIYDHSWNDQLGKMALKQNDTIMFKFTNMYHPNLKGDSYIRGYRKGFGFIGNWNEIKIGDSTFKYNNPK